jgi:hypothetical protein
MYNENYYRRTKALRHYYYRRTKALRLRREKVQIYYQNRFAIAYGNRFAIWIKTFSQQKFFRLQ